MITRDAKNILVADDSEFFRVKLEYILNEAGHTTEVVDSGRQIIELLKRRGDAFDLVMADLHMPEISGYDVLEWMKEKAPVFAVPVIAVTEEYEPGNEGKGSLLDEMKNHGAAGLITKVQSPNEIVHIVNSLLFHDKGKRKDIRAPLSLPVECAAADFSTTINLLNLSESGLFLQLSRKIETGTALDLRLSLPGSETPISLRGEVRWHTPCNGKEHFFSGAGVDFENISADDRKCLKSYVEERLQQLGCEEHSPVRVVFSA